MMMRNFDLAAREFSELVDELLGCERCAVPRRVDVAHGQILSRGRAGGQHDRQRQADREDMNRSSRHCDLPPVRLIVH
jgi:hypothetical protein